MFKDLSVKKAILLDIVLQNSAEYKLASYFDSIDSYALDTFQTSNFQNSLALTIPSLEIFSISDSNLRQDAIDGFVIKASVTVTLRDMDTDETFIMFKGQVSRSTIYDFYIDLDCQGLMGLTEQDLNPVYTIECTNDLGDDNCGVNVSSFTETGTITDVFSRSEFEDTSRTEVDDYFQYGMFTFTTGNNAGLEREVLSYDSSTTKFKMFIPFPYDVEIGDAYSVYRGCQKTQDECTNTYSNWENFRGWGLFAPKKQDELQYVPEDDDGDIDEDSDEEAI